MVAGLELDRIIRESIKADKSLKEKLEKPIRFQTVIDRPYLDIDNKSHSKAINQDILNRNMGGRGKPEFSTEKVDEMFRNRSNIDLSVQDENYGCIPELFIQYPVESNYICKILHPMFGKVIVAHENANFYQETINPEGNVSVRIVGKDDLPKIEKYFKSLKGKYLRLENPDIDIINKNAFENIISDYARNNAFSARISIGQDDTKKAYFLTDKGKFCNFNKQTVKSDLMKTLVELIRQVLVIKDYQEKGTSINIISHPRVNVDIYDGINLEELYQKHAA